MSDIEWASCDIETGGWSEKANTLCSVGIVIMDDRFNIIGGHYVLIKDRPGLIYHPEAMAKNGLDANVCKRKGTPIGPAMKAVGMLLRDRRLITHNGGIEARFLNARGVNIKEYYDTQRMYVKVHGKGDGCKLVDCAQHLEIPVFGAHNAFQDAWMTALVFAKLAREPKLLPIEKNIVAHNQAMQTTFADGP